MSGKMSRMLFFYCFFHRVRCWSIKKLRISSSVFVVGLRGYPVRKFSGWEWYKKLRTVIHSNQALMTPLIHHYWNDRSDVRGVVVHWSWRHETVSLKARQPYYKNSQWSNIRCHNFRVPPACIVLYTISSGTDLRTVVPYKTSELPSTYVNQHV